MQTINKVQVRNIAPFVEKKELFKAESVYSEEFTDSYGEKHYVVYSYRSNWPIFIYVEGIGWIENTQKYSATTSKHCSYARRNIKVDQEVDTNTANKIVDTIRLGKNRVSDKVLLILLGVK